MTINRAEQDGKVIFAVEGRVDTTTANEFQEIISADIDNTDAIVLDCAGLIYISSAGLRVLLSVHKSMNKKGGSFVLTNVNADINEIFDITGFSSILSVE